MPSNSQAPGLRITPFSRLVLFTLDLLLYRPTLALFRRLSCSLSPSLMDGLCTPTLRIPSLTLSRFYLSRSASRRPEQARPPAPRSPTARGRLLSGGSPRRIRGKGRTARVACIRGLACHSMRPGCVSARASARCTVWLTFLASRRRGQLRMPRTEEAKARPRRPKFILHGAHQDRGHGIAFTLRVRPEAPTRNSVPAAGGARNDVLFWS